MKDPYVKVERDTALQRYLFFTHKAILLPAGILEELAHEIHTEGLNPHQN